MLNTSPVKKTEKGKKKKKTPLIKWGLASEQQIPAVCTLSQTPGHQPPTHRFSAMIDGEEHCHRHRAIPTLNIQRLKIIAALGRGAKGVVFLVRGEEVGELMALKVILRDSVEKKRKKKKSEVFDNKDRSGDEYRRVCFEQEVLGRFQHPLLPRLRGVLATEKIIGYAIDYCPGRDLNSFRKKQTENMFSVDIIRFYAAELVLALEYVHSLGIVYRDLKPENVMIQESGHIMLVDFDLSTKLSPKSPQTAHPNLRTVQKPESVNKKRLSPFHRWCNSGISPEDSVSSTETRHGSTQSESDSTEKSNSFVGTEEYVPPEIISGDGHDFAVDWWSLGILLYEMLYGRTPFRGINRKETFYRILTKQPELVGETTPLRDLIGKLLIKDPKQRISLEGIKGHEFFKGMDWDLVLRISRPPYVPGLSWSEDAKENGIIDMESFVEGIFGGREDGKNKEDHEKINTVENTNKRVWVEGLIPYPHQPNDFFVF